MFSKGLLLLALGAFYVNAFAQQVAIVRNFDHQEIDTLQAYLTGMSVSSKVFDQSGLTIDSLAGFDLIIWDDLSFAGGGIANVDVFLYDAVRQNGQNLYFIGDDLAFSTPWALTPPADSIWTGLIHLTATINTPASDSIIITGISHPVTNGFYGKVDNFPSYIDPDNAVQTNSGEMVLAQTDTEYDVIVVYENEGFKSVTQNVLAYKPNDPSGQANRKILFQNAVYWLLDENISAIETESIIPEKFMLYQNYPNPFNPATVIRYSVGEDRKASLVQLDVYDISGKKIKTLVNQKQSSGNYEVTFNAENLASGVYLYKLKIASFEQSLKMILIR